MKYEIQIKKALITDNKKTFRVGDDIKFNIFNKETNYHDMYIGEIKEITDNSNQIINSFNDHISK